MKKTIKILSTLATIIIILTYTVYADDVENEEENNLEQVINEETINTAGKITSQPETNSRRYVVYDRISKTVIFGKNEDTKGAMASTTKIMTATIVLENADLTETVEVSNKAGATGGSRLGLKKGDKTTVEDLLYGLMLRSGNDAAVALAEHVAGSVDDFANLMNKKAEELNLKNTHFVTPHGLDDANHYTTATELAKLTDYALQNEKFAEIVGTKITTIYINNSPRQIANTNELLGTLNGVIGVKTGFTNNAGRCLVTETKRANMDIITVVLGADTKKDRTKDSIKLIEYTYANYKMYNIQEKIIEEFNNWKNINEKRITVIKGQKDVLALALGEIEIKQIPLKESDHVEIKINSISTIDAPVSKWTKTGTLTVSINGNILEEIEIINTEYINKKTWQDYFKELLQNFLLIKIL